MKHALIIGHPDPDSFIMSVVDTYENAVGALGHVCVRRDLYRIGFDPCLAQSELPTRTEWAPQDDAAEERRLLGDADVFAFFYPLWFNAPPAIIKGYIDRVFGVGFGYAMKGWGDREPLLSGRQLVNVTSSGSTRAWLNEQGSWTSLWYLFDKYFGAVCGMDVRPHIHLDSVIPGMDARDANEKLTTVRMKVAEFFGGPAIASPQMSLLDQAYGGERFS